MARPIVFPLWCYIALLGSFPLFVEASVACNETYNPCEKLFFKGSECRNGFCSNPFEKGCLQTLLNSPDDGSLSAATRERLSSLIRRLKSQVRVCNSYDPPEAAAQGLCISHSSSPIKNYRNHYKNEEDSPQSELYADYKEIRVHSQNWESSFFSAWIIQILLSEILQVPTTIESGTLELSQQNNFYDPQARLGYGIQNDWDAFRHASEAEGADCTKVQEDAEANGRGYKPCAHAVLEYWNGFYGDYQGSLQAGIVEPLKALGAIGQQGIFVTKFTAEEDPTILNLLGIQGDQNRRKLAETFKRPTTWKDYCETVSPNNCSVPDDVAQRPPLNNVEQERMHVPGVYTGYFLATEQNDCDLNPNNCTGHFGDFPCGWVSFAIPQLHFNNIALRSDGKEPGSRGYTYQQLGDMWAAANATRSNLITMWWTPEALHSTYLGTESEMQKISLTWPTQECSENRISAKDRCYYEEPAEQFGDPAGSCDEAPQLLHKVVATNFFSATYDSSIPEAQRSPAYDAIQAFGISELQYGEMLTAWISRGVDKYGFDPRMATCQWVLENLDHVQSFIPRSYPRAAAQKEFYDDPLNIAAMSLGCLALALTLISTLLTYIWRKSCVIVYAQVEFLFLLLLGLVLVSFGAVTLATEPNSASCLASIWLVLLGYSFQFVPLILKVAAIHKLVTAAERLRRIELPKNQLFGTVAVLIVAIVVFMACWVVIDPRRPYIEFILTDEVDEDGQTIVTMDPYCSSSKPIWQIIVSAWFFFLMMCTTVLAFKTRHIREEFNESKALGFMVYSHFLFLVLLVGTLLFKGALREAYLVTLRSMLYSADSIVTICIYFLPKFAVKDEPRGGQSMHRLASHLSSANNNRISDGNINGSNDINGSSNGHLPNGH